MFTSLYLRMLNKEASSPKNRPREILENLGIREGFAIADIGSGGGYFTLEFAKIVGRTGQVYAVDSQRKNLDFIRRRSEREGLDNIAFVLSTAEAIDLPESGLDLIFVRNVFHHLPEPGRYFHNLRRFLRPSGRLALIEHKPTGGLSFVAMFRHYTPVEVIMREIENAGYLLAQSFDFLPDQTFNLFGIE